MDFIFDPSLVLYLPLYELDGASIMSKDKHGHLCTVTGALWRPNGRYFDGTDDYIVVPHNSCLNPGTDDFTVICWAKNTVSALGALVTKWEAGASYNGWVMAVNTDGTTRYQFFQNGGAGIRARESSDTVNDDAWHCVAGTYVLNNLPDIYIDGSLSNGTSNSVGNITDVSPSTDVRIGERTPGDWDYAGDIGEVFVYNRALTSLEIHHSYLATKWRYQ